MFNDQVQQNINKLSNLCIKQANGDIQELERQIVVLLEDASRLRDGGGLQCMKLERAENLQKEVDRIKSAQ